MGGGVVVVFSICLPQMMLRSLSTLVDLAPVVPRKTSTDLNHTSNESVHKIARQDSPTPLKIARVGLELDRQLGVCVVGTKFLPLSWL